MLYEGSCHRVLFEVDGKIDQAIECTARGVELTTLQRIRYDGLSA